MPRTVTCTAPYSARITFEIDLTPLSAVPWEALANFMTVNVRRTMSLIVATSATQRCLRTDSSRVSRIFRQIGPTFSTRALIRSTKIKASCVLRTVVMWTSFLRGTLIKVPCIDLKINEKQVMRFP